MTTYNEFLETKIPTPVSSGIVVSADKLHPSLWRHQPESVLWALRGGRRALFQSFGLGKTRQQLEIARQIIAHSEDGQFLIVLPLGVRREFALEAAALGIEITYVTNDVEASLAGRLLMTNYERVRDGHLSPEYLGDLLGVSLDEASVLRSYGSKTFHTFVQLFGSVPFRFVATATPSPNRFKELIHYAHFLGVMDSGQALTRFFQRNPDKAGDLTLIPHKEREFWLWVSSWGLFLTKPSDLGHSDEGYDLPEISVHWHCVDVQNDGDEQDSWGQGMMFRNAAAGVQQAAREKRDTLTMRLDKAREVIEAHDPSEHWILWHHLEREREAIEELFMSDQAFASSATVYGNQDLDERERLIGAFADGDLRILATKPEIAGSGTNLQRHCHRAIFMGIDYRFNDFIQAIHRIHRFQQAHPVEIHIIYADSEIEIVRVLKRKWAQHDAMTETMTELVKRYGLSEAARRDDLQRTIGVDRREVKATRFTAVNNDCVTEVSTMPANSVDLIMTSIPFSNQYEYTPSYNDFGHNEGDDSFFGQMDYLVPELLRVAKHGRLAAVHVKDRIQFGNVTGYGMPSVNPFSDKTVAAFVKHGWIFVGRITVVTDVVRENNQTYRLGWTEMCKDGTKMGAGMPEYVLLFRKLPSDTSRSYADEPVTHRKHPTVACPACNAELPEIEVQQSQMELAGTCPECEADVDFILLPAYTRAQWQVDAHGFWRSSGDRLLTPDELAALEMDVAKAWYERWSATHVYDYPEHIVLGRELEAQGRLPSSFMLLSPSSWHPDVWTDVARMRTLNGEQSRRQQENHVCPLQFDIVERLIERFSNKGELVMDPFAGIGTVPYCAVRMERRGYGVELNAGYWHDSLNYLRAAESEVTAPSLFDFLEVHETETETVGV